jgi:hypothetical protein
MNHGLFLVGAGLFLVGAVCTDIFTPRPPLECKKKKFHACFLSRILHSNKALSISSNVRRDLCYMGS